MKRKRRRRNNQWKASKSVMAKAAKEENGENERKKISIYRKNNKKINNVEIMAMAASGKIMKSESESNMRNNEK